MTDHVAQAKQVVEAYLERSMTPDPTGAARYVAPDLQITFTGGRAFTAPAQTAAFNAMLGSKSGSSVPMRSQIRTPGTSTSIIPGICMALGPMGRNLTATAISTSLRCAVA